jgi:hypothetical protein
MDQEGIFKKKNQSKIIRTILLCIYFHISYCISSGAHLLNLISYKHVRLKCIHSDRPVEILIAHRRKFIEQSFFKNKRRLITFLMDAQN